MAVAEVMRVVEDGDHVDHRLLEVGLNRKSSVGRGSGDLGGSGVRRRFSLRLRRQLAG